MGGLGEAHVNIPEVVECHDAAGRILRRKWVTSRHLERTETEELFEECPGIVKRRNLPRKSGRAQRRKVLSPETDAWVGKRGRRMREGNRRRANGSGVTVPFDPDPNTLMII